MKVVTLLLACCLFSLALAVSPGFKITLSQAGVNYAKDVGVAYLLKKLAVVHVPDQGGEAHAPVVGKIDWSLKNIVLSGLQIPSSAITFNAGRGLTVSIGGAAIHASMDFKYRRKSWPHISGHGSVDISMSGTSIVIVVALGEANGRPTLAVAGTSVGIGHLDIKVHAHDGWIYQFFIDILKGLIKKEAEKALSSAITSELNKGGNEALQTMPVIEKVGHLAEVDFSFLSAPTIQSSYFTVNAKGEFYYIPKPSEAPFTPTALPDVMNSEMVQIFFGEYVPNTASYVFYTAGIMQALLTDKDLPSWSPVRLNTSSFKDLVPELYKKYPNMLMEARVLATQTPTVTFTSGGITAQGLGQIQVSVIQPNGQVIPVVVLGVTLGTSAKAYIMSGNMIGATLSYVGSTLSLVSSTIGTFDVSVLNGIIKEFATRGVVPFFNYFLQQGIPIPTIRGVTFVNPVIGYGNGFLYVSTNVVYNGGASDDEMEMTNLIVA
jgi:lipopolysaccharide-binding protein